MKIFSFFHFTWERWKNWRTWRRAIDWCRSSPCLLHHTVPIIIPALHFIWRNQICLNGYQKPWSGERRWSPSACAWIDNATTFTPQQKSVEGIVGFALGLAAGESHSGWQIANFLERFGDFVVPEIFWWLSIWYPSFWTGKRANNSSG